MWFKAKTEESRTNQLIKFDKLAAQVLFANKAKKESKRHSERDFSAAVDRMQKKHSDELSHKKSKKSLFAQDNVQIEEEKALQQQHEA